MLFVWALTTTLRLFGVLDAFGPSLSFSPIDTTSSGQLPPAPLGCPVEQSPCFGGVDQR